LSGKVDGATIRDRASRLRAIGRELSDAFRRSQAGTTRRALVVDDGWSAVTDNYLKVKLERRHERNQWVHARVDASDISESGAPSAAPPIS
jgi:tRNA A37 methylthiotransferase MiaB